MFIDHTLVYEKTCYRKKKTEYKIIEAVSLVSRAGEL